MRAVKTAFDLRRGSRIGVRAAGVEAALKGSREAPKENAPRNTGRLHMGLDTELAQQHKALDDARAALTSAEANAGFTESQRLGYREAAHRAWVKFETARLATKVTG